MKRRLPPKEAKKLRQARVYPTMCSFCNKRGYEREYDAWRVIEETDGRAGTRAYQCSDSGLYHLTKQESFG